MLSDRERLIELCNKKINTMQFRNSDEWFDFQQKVEQIADHLLSNGVMVPPCKFLQKCFVIPAIENNLFNITEMKCIGFSLSHDSYNANLITDKNKLYQPCFGRFGETVFLTREEAEKALERSKDDE